MRTGNPTLNKNTFGSYYGHFKEHMTIDGTVNKTFIMLLIVMITAFYSWTSLLIWDPMITNLVLIGASIFSLIFALITVFKREWAPYTAPFYALFEGLLLGTISAFFEYSFPGIVFQAIALTFGTLFVLLLAYKSNIIKATENFRLGLFAATGAIFLVYFVSMILGFFGQNIPYIHDAGPIGIGFSLIVVAIAALNLVLDFDFIEKGAHNKAPKFMEWYAAFGLMVTLIWLYVEILRLLAKMRSRD